MIKLVLVRHGQSMWNLENKFTGWTDVELSEQGIQEAKEAGKILKEKGFHFDLAFTSVLKRAEDTLDYILKEMGEENIEIKRSWRLNERHYGALQGLNKDETREKTTASTMRHTVGCNWSCISAVWGVRDKSRDGTNRLEHIS